jgi:hypothetical protein
MFGSIFGHWTVGYLDSSTGFAIIRTYLTRKGAQRSRLYRLHGTELGLAVKYC